MSGGAIGADRPWRSGRRAAGGEPLQRPPGTLSKSTSFQPAWASGPVARPASSTPAESPLFWSRRSSSIACSASDRHATRSRPAQLPLLPVSTACVRSLHMSSHTHLRPPCSGEPAMAPPKRPARCPKRDRRRAVRALPAANGQAAVSFSPARRLLEPQTRAARSCSERCARHWPMRRRCGQCVRT